MQYRIKDFTVGPKEVCMYNGQEIDNNVVTCYMPIYLHQAGYVTDSSTET